MRRRPDLRSYPHHLTKKARAPLELATSGRLHIFRSGTPSLRSISTRSRRSLRLERCTLNLGALRTTDCQAITSPRCGCHGGRYSHRVNRGLWGTVSAASLAAGALSLGLSSCSSTTTGSNSTQGLAAGFGRLSGSVGPGVPPSGTIPNMVLTFSSATSSFRTTVIGGKYEIDLPAGSWDVRSSNGVCATGISVTAGAWQRDNLGYPMAQCQSLSGPAGPISPPPPQSP